MIINFVLMQKIVNTGIPLYFIYLFVALMKWYWKRFLKYSGIQYLTHHKVAFELNSLLKCLESGQNWSS